MKKALYYVATQDEKYLVLALCSALEFNFYDKDVDIYILTDFKIFKENEFIDYNIRIINIEVEQETADKNQFSNFKLYGKFNNRKYKILGYRYLPKNYDQILYLDADILPVNSNNNIWEYLKDNDICFSVDIAKKLGKWKYFDTKTEGEYTKTICAKDQTLFNGGVFLFNLNDKNIDFLVKWYAEWIRYKLLDQLALARTIKILKTEIGELDTGYNFCPSIARDNEMVNSTIINVHLRKWIIPEKNLYQIYEKHSKICLDILLKYYLKRNLEDIISKEV